MKKQGHVINQTRVKSTEAFIASFLIREKLAAAPMSEEDCTTSEEVSLRPMNPFNPFPREGQVRLLSQVDQLTYVLLARKWGEDAYLVIPFSHYADPATDMELKLRKDAGAYLQVLQLWNARTLQIETLRESWLIGMLDVKDLEDALAMWKYSVGGAMPAEEIVGRTGVPIARRDDPRIRYQDEVLRDFAQLDVEDLKTAERGRSMPGPIVIPLWEEQRLAAGGTTTSTVRRSRCRVKGLSGEVEVVYSSTRKRLLLEVFDENGETTVALDGWHFLYHDGTDFGVIEGGKVVSDGVAECNGACCLLDLAGKVSVLMPKKGK